MQARLARLERQHAQLARICGHCGGGGGGPQAVAVADVEDSHIVCQSLECGIYFERSKTRHELRNVRALSAAALALLDAES